MKKTKTQKGITLIALIITIIVLLILAVVAIGAVQNDGIIEHAKNARDEYQSAQTNEQTTLNSYLSKLEGAISDKEKIGKATVGTKVTVNSTIDGKAYSSTNPIIPAGFKAINTETSSWNAEAGPEVTKGLVISDGNSEFVWIPVANLNEFAKVTSEEKDANGRTNYQGVLYNFSGTTATEMADYGQGTEIWREPANLSTDKTTNLSIWTETLYQESFNKMVESVDKYDGFYVGRYETSLNGSIAQSIAGETPMDDINWWDMYEYSLTYSAANTSLGVESEMIWGCQWDAMLRFILTGSEASHVTSTSNVSHDLSGIYYYKTGGTDYTGTIKYNDISSNIYDLEGNLMEWTQEAVWGDYRVSRGGHIKLDGKAPSYRSEENFATNNWWNLTGSRLSLYIK